MPNKKQLLLAAASVFLVYISSPGNPAPLLSLLWLVPLGTALCGASVLQSVSLAAGFALSAWSLCIWWLLPTMIRFSQMHFIFALLLFAAVCCYCSLPYAVFGLLFGHFQWLQRRWGAVRSSAALTALVCGVPSLIPGHPVHALYRHPLLIQCLDIGGIPLLVFATSLMQCLLIKALCNGIRSRRITSVAGAVLAAGIVAGYGWMRLSQLHGETASGDNAPRLTVGFIQPCLQRGDDADVLFSLTEELVEKHPDADLVVWPEIPVPFSITDNGSQQCAVRVLARTCKKRLMVVSGYVYAAAPTKKNPHPHYYNTLHLVQKDGTADAYHKLTLVPFFEYLPGEKQVPALRKLFPYTLHYVPGKEPAVFEFSAGITIIPAICYEVIFAENISGVVRRGGNVIINPVNDAWLGTTAGPYYHFALALFRAVENRVPVIRITNSGISGCVQATGEITSETERLLWTRGTGVCTVYLPAERSAYVHWGNACLYCITVFFVIDLIYAGLIEKRRRKKCPGPAACCFSRRAGGRISRRE